jgi:hypothetical protein
MKSSATSVEGYLRQLPEERRIVVAAVREVIRENVPAGYREGFSWGAITWEVPLERYPDTYNGQPLCYVALAAQKNHYAVYLMCVYGDPAATEWLKGEFEKAGKKLDMGKSCVRFRKLDDLPLGVIGKAVARIRLKDYLARYEAARAKTKTGLRKSARPKAAAPGAATKPRKAAAKRPRTAP